ncbi:hypothetical protein H2201_008907 [Coniosporium apollinis]|uniref:Uncharacterized protein n=1 Tax=Coniosporium apollinis TaxID=61459 RepID=A0ABQ9NFS8_9PEZI|nr:hypothetical protein H2201_008907 [Coniosporium apollinis]
MATAGTRGGADSEWRRTLKRIRPKKATAEGDTKQYSFFNPKLRDNSYHTGDIYDKATAAEARQKWELHTSDKPYLTHVKFLSNTWPHLRLLADFMEVSTTPVRWGSFDEAQRRERAQRTKVTQLVYLASNEVIRRDYNTCLRLRKILKGGFPKIHNVKVQLRLFVVEDLSREVIEVLGEHFDIEPAFFREHIVDYAWYNTRDPWVDPPNLDMVARRQLWFQLRFVRARYFKTTASFKNGCKEADLFNVSRRPDDDQNNKAWWDEEGAIVGITRTRASFWMKRPEGHEKEAVAVLLLDPTIKEGVPLWCGYRNWESTPSIKIKEKPPRPPRDSFFNDFIYWAQRPGSFGSTPSSSPASNIHIPIQALLHLVCAEWLTMADYIKTRLGQIDWEIAYPDHFLQKGVTIDEALNKLHVWRRLVPLYREMLNETLQRVFRFPCHTTDLISSGTGLSSTSNSGTDDSTGVDHNHCHSATRYSPSIQQGPISAYRADFTRALSYMEEYQKRIDRLSSLVAAVISIKDSRRGLEENRNLARLTWLATFFIPLSFVTSLFSMQNDIRRLRPTFRLYFAGPETWQAS